MAQRRSRVSRRFSVVQLPMADLRQLVAFPTARLSRPSWPDPIPVREFVRAVGMVRDRPRGTIRDWSGERAFCDARGLIRLPPPSASDTVDVRVTPQYRRLYVGEVALRLDVGVHLRWRQDSTAKALELPSTVAMLPIGVPDHGKPLALAAAGTRVAQRLAIVTTTEGATVHTELLQPGTPMVMLEGPTRTECAATIAATDGASFTGSDAWVGGSRIPVWAVSVQPGCDVARVRQIRGHLWRLHTEREALRNVLRAWRQDAARFDPTLLRDYLARQLKVLAKPKRFGIDQGPLLRRAQWIESLASPDVIDDLRGELRKESLGIVRLLDRMMEQSTAPEPGRYLTIHVGSGGQVSMTEGDSYTVHGDALGSAFGPGSRASGGTFWVDRSAVDPRLSELATRTSALVEQHPNLRAGVVAAQREFEAEVTGDEPSPGRIKAAGLALLEYAKSAGAVGLPVVQTIVGIMTILGLAS
ncbi:MAG: hypothetical protein GEV04_00865 [Actinophytocola sp.]|nr:hypothetical protein [Actinophytocola sp.]